MLTTLPYKHKKPLDIWLASMESTFVKSLEKIQRRAILQDWTFTYRDRLILPLATWLELQDILFLVKDIKQPSDNFNILDHVKFKILSPSLQQRGTWCTTTREPPLQGTSTTTE